MTTTMTERPLEGGRELRVCSRPGCNRRAYSARTGWLCYEHAMLLHPDAGEMSTASEALSLILPYTRLGYTITSVLEAAGVDKHAGTNVKAG